MDAKFYYVRRSDRQSEMEYGYATKAELDDWYSKQGVEAFWAQTIPGANGEKVYEGVKAE